MLIEDIHRKEFNQIPQIIIRVPDVTILLGEFASYSRGHVLCCANGRELFIAISESRDGQIHMLNTFTNDKKKFALTSLKFRKEDKWGNYVKGVFSGLNERSVGLKSYNISFSGPVLRDSSPTLASAMSVGVCLALRDALGLDMDDTEIAGLCCRSCTEYCEENVKYSTIITMLKAREGKYLFFDLNTLSFSYLDDPFAGKGCGLLSVDCRIPPSAMREELVHKHSQVRASFGNLKEKAPYITLSDFPISDLTDRIVPIDENSRRICKAVLEINAAASSVHRLFSMGDGMQIGRLFSHIGDLIRNVLDFSCPEIDWLSKRAAEVPGCYGSALMFNGDSVYVVLVIQEQAVKAYSLKLEEYERIFGFKAIASAFTPRGCWERVDHGKTHT